MLYQNSESEMKEAKNLLCLCSLKIVATMATDKELWVENKEKPLYLEPLLYEGLDYWFQFQS